MITLAKTVDYVQRMSKISDAHLSIIINNAIVKTREYIENNNLKSLVIGISGGLDSAVVAAILREENTGIPLIGLSIPMHSSYTHKEQADWVGEKYCTVYEEFNEWDDPPYIEKTESLGENPHEVVESILQLTHYVAGRAGFSNFPDDILQGNIKARLRMMTLYDLARKTNGMVLSTDNLSEYMAGFWTINGDVGDWGIIQNIWKGLELQQIARFLGVREDIIMQKPSDGLNVTHDDTDEAQLGMTYPEFDTIIGCYFKMFDFDEGTNEELYDDIFHILIEDNGEDGQKVRGAIKRYKNTQFKRTGTINLTREELWDY